MPAEKESIVIVDTFENVDLYAPCCWGLKQAVDFARQFDPAAADGKIEIDGQRMYAMVLSYKTKSTDGLPFEAHKKYLDVQILLRGEERMDVSLDADLPIQTPYSEDADAILFDAPDSYSSLVAKPGQFAAFFPEDIHRPSAALGGASADVRKLVVKIRLQN